MNMTILLPPPDDAIDNPDAVEVLRGWVVGGDLQVSLAFDAFGNNTSVWGQLLAETAVHVADALALQGRGDQQVLLAAIHASFLENIQNPCPGLNGTIGGPKQ